jgi:predicted TIM-barrel fold metal-dependent hydrolase
MTDPAGLELIRRIGPETAMWSSDYPHQESTFGYTRSAIQAVFDCVPSVDDAQKILGKTALDVFDMHEPYFIPQPKPKRARRARPAAAAAG